MLIDSGRLFRSGGRWVLGPEPVDDLPPELLGVVRSRLNGLPAEDQRVLDTVAVAGGTIDHHLTVALHPDEGELLLARAENSILLMEEAHRPAICNELASGDVRAERRLAEDAQRLARGERRRRRVPGNDPVRTP